MALWYYGSYTDEYKDLKFFKILASRYYGWSSDKVMENVAVFKIDSKKLHGPETKLQNYTRQVKNGGLGVAGHIKANPAIYSYSNDQEQDISVSTESSRGGEQENIHDPSLLGLLTGLVGFFSDSNGSHFAILLEVKPEAKMIFLTSKKHWNPKARAATKDEMLLLARTHKHTNYFAPVVRSIHNFESVGYFFPQHRVLELIEEFWGA